MSRTRLAAAAAALFGLGAMTALGGQALAQPSGGPGGWGMMGYGMGPMMGGYGMMGPMMMGGGYGGMMGPMMMGGGYGGMMGGWGGATADLKLSAKDVSARMDRWLAFMGNPHVKLGPVVEKDADTITADVVTTDKGGLVQRFEINRHNGLSRPAGG